MRISKDLEIDARRAFWGLSPKEREQLSLRDLVHKVKSLIQGQKFSEETYIYAAIRAVAQHTSYHHIELRHAQRFQLTPECYLLRVALANPHCTTCRQLSHTPRG